MGQPPSWGRSLVATVGISSNFFPFSVVGFSYRHVICWLCFTNGRFLSISGKLLLRGATTNKPFCASPVGYGPRSLHPERIYGVYDTLTRYLQFGNMRLCS